MFVNERFRLNKDTVEDLNRMPTFFGFGLFGAATFYRTYSRNKDDSGLKETWTDCVLRVVEGVMSIRKDWYLKNKIKWNESEWQHFAHGMAISLHQMKWMPPGRGLYAMGTEFMYERGSMCLYNCSATYIGNDSLASDIHWLMDCLMCGVGVGFHPIRENLVVTPGEGEIVFEIPDTREGWCDSVKMLIQHYTHRLPKPKFKYNKIRKKGQPIRGFGGKASGPEPLIYLHNQIEDFFDMFQKETWYDEILLKADIANAVGCCVVAGNVRRSAELCSGSIEDETFLNLKRYDIYPHRAEFGWMSNNSAYLDDDADFDKLGEIARRVVENGEPGYINLQNTKLGRIGRDVTRIDLADLFNPCGEIPLENRELCNVAESAPTLCLTIEEWLRACEYATFYMSTVSLLPTHRSSSNRIIARNRRIGLSIMDWTGWVHTYGLNKVIKWMRLGYKRVRSANQHWNAEAGVPEAIRVTTIKPGGTVPKVAGLTSGIGYPNFHHTLRRMRISNLSSICQVLADAGVPYEPDVNQPDSTLVFEFPIIQGPAKPANKTSLLEQAMNLVLVQANWADNAVSNTLVFDESEKDLIEYVLSSIAPSTKSVSLIENKCSFHPQMPEAELSPAEYEKRLKAIKEIDWNSFRDIDGADEKYCSGTSCEISR